MIRLDTLSGDAFDSALEDLAHLRIRVFRDWPYLYDGDLAYERRYLENFQSSERAMLVGAFDGDAIVGAATGAPMQDHADEFAEAFSGTDLDLSDVYYCAESVLLPEYRGQGIGHMFFDAREAHARSLGFSKVAFCGVLRPVDHPLRPESARSLNAFWRKRGYAPLPGVVAQFRWKDVDQQTETAKPLQFWMREV